MSWELLRNEIYYQDGSLRDIYVFETTRNEWEKWIDFVNNNFNVSFYNGITEQTETKIDRNAVFNFWDHKTDLPNNVTINLGNITLKCYFFTDSEIENDITPNDINSMDDHTKLLNYLESISLLLNRNVILTPENFSELGLITVSNGKATINLNN